MRNALLACLLLLSPVATAQVIDFEALPDGSPTIDQQEICDEYLPLGVAFRLLDRTTGMEIGCPLIAKTGDPKTAFSGCTGSDLPLPNQGTGVTTLTDGTSLGAQADLLVTYTTPVSQCSGVILDLDCRTGGQAPCEQWTIEARDAMDNVLATEVLDAPPGPSDPICDPNAGPGDSLAATWSFDLPGQQIASVFIRHTGPATNVGLAFDNFTPSSLLPVSVEPNGPSVPICAGHAIELYGKVSGGVPPYAVQWEEETSPGVWAELGAEPSEIVSPSTTTTYRVQVADDGGGMDQGTVVVDVVAGAGNPVCDARLLVSSPGNDRILRYDPVTLTFVDTFVAAASGGLDGPAKLRFDRAGNLLVNSQVNNRVLRYNGVTGAFIDAFVPSGATGPNVPVGLAVGPDGHVYVANAGTNDVRRYDGATGAYIDTFVSAGSGSLSTPTGIEFGPDGRLYVSSRGNNRINRYDGATGTFVDNFVPAGVQLGNPRGLVLRTATDGDLFVSSENGDKVERFDAATGLGKGPHVLPNLGGLDRANDVIFGPEGNLYVASLNNDKVLVFGEHTGIFIGEFPSGNGLDRPAWLEFEIFCGDGVCDPVRGETPCNCPDDCGAPAPSEAVCDDGIDNDCNGAFDCTDTECSGGVVCSGSGALPRDSVLGVLLLVNPGAGDTLDLTWGSSCTAADNDFAVYEGLLGLPGSHTPETCSTGGASTWTVNSPGDGDRYYLVVPRNAATEGSSGTDSDGADRPQGVFPCTTRVITCP